MVEAKKVKNNLDRQGYVMKSMVMIAKRLTFLIIAIDILISLMLEVRVRWRGVVEVERSAKLSAFTAYGRAPVHPGNHQVGSTQFDKQ